NYRLCEKEGRVEIGALPWGSVSRSRSSNRECESPRPAFGQGYLCFRPRQVSRIASQIKLAQARKHQDLLATWSKITHHCVSDGALAHLICLKVDTAPSPGRPY